MAGAPCTLTLAGGPATVVQLPAGPDWTAASRAPELVSATTSAWPVPTAATAGTPVSPVSVPAGCHDCQPLGALAVSASVPDFVTQKTCRPPPAGAAATGELAQLPPMAVHGVQPVSAPAACWLVTWTTPVLPVTNTDSWPAGPRTAAGSPVTLPGEPDPMAPPQCQPLGWPRCCHACTTEPARSSANTVRCPSASAATAGLLARLAGESPTVLACDHPDALAASW